MKSGKWRRTLSHDHLWGRGTCLPPASTFPSGRWEQITSLRGRRAGRGRPHWQGMKHGCGGATRGAAAVAVCVCARGSGHPLSCNSGRAGAVGGTALSRICSGLPHEGRPNQELLRRRECSSEGKQKGRSFDSQAH